MPPVQPLRTTVEQVPTRKRLLVLILGRAFFVLLLTLFMVMFHRGQVLAFASPAIRLLFGAVTTTLAVTGIYLAFWYRQRRGMYWLAFVQIQLDLILWGIILMVTGGVNSYFTFLFHLSIVLSAVYLGDRGVIFTLVLSLTSYLLVVIAGLLDWFPGLGSVLDVNAQPDVGDLVVALTLDMGSMMLVAMLGWVLALQVARAGESLERTQEIFEDLHRLNQAIVTLLPSGLITTDGSGRIRSVNPAATWILGMQQSELLGERIEEVLGDAGSIPRAGEGSGETRLRLEDREVLVEYATSDLRDAEGRVIGAIVHVMDVTEQRRMRRQLGEFEKYRALGDLAVGLAHEIRNPLGSIAGSIELVKESGDLAEQDRRLLDIVHRETDKIGRLVTSLFNLARPPDPVLAPLTVAPLVREVAALLARDPQMRGIHLETELDDRLEVLADRDQLGQVMLNLLRNAAEASRDGEGRVVVQTRRPDAGWIEILVLDSGRGLDPEILDHVFDPYFTTKSYGIGVGLSLCRDIVERHGGTIGISNRPQGGAVATVRLPAPRPGEAAGADF